MALVARLIWRFDFPIAYDYIDNRGSALRTLLTKFDKYFENASETQQDGINVERTTDTEKLMMNIDRVNINGSMFFYTGCNLSNVLGSEMFERSNAIVSELISLSKVSKINRAGFRLIMACENKHIPKANEAEYLSAAPLKSVTEVFGPMDDSAVITVGKAADETSYRHQTGPLRRTNIDGAHEMKVSDANWEKFAAFPSICDIDLFDLDFTLTTSLYKWALPKLQRVEKWVATVSEK